MHSFSRQRKAFRDCTVLAAYDRPYGSFVAFLASICPSTSTL